LDGAIDQKVASYIGFYEFKGCRCSSASACRGGGAPVLLPARRQDKAKITFRDRDVPIVPNAEQMALLHREVPAQATGSNGRGGSPPLRLGS
jgi:hypothetical protein